MAAPSPGVTNHELATLGEYHDRIIAAITDPDALAEEACRVGLLPLEDKRDLQSLPFDTKTRTLSLVWSIREKVESVPVFFHHFINLLKKLPGLAGLGMNLQKTYALSIAAERVLTERDIYMLMNRIHNYSHKWSDIGLRLGFFPSELDQISCNPSLFMSTSAPTRSMTRLLSQWVQWPTENHPTRPTLRALCETLRSAIVGLGSLAEELEREVMCSATAVGYKRSAHMEHSPQKFPRIYAGNQQSSVITEQSASSSCWNQFNSPPFHAGNYVAAHVSGSLPSSNQLISPPPQQHPSPGPSRSPSQAGSLHNTGIMESPHQFSRLDSVPQHISAHIQHSVPSTYLTEFNTSPFTTGHCLLPQPASGSFPPAVSNQQIHQPPLNPSLSGLSTLPSQDDPLLRHRPKLAAFYSHQPEVPEGTWPPVKKTQYINLALIRTEQAVDFNKEFLRQTIRGSIDDIMKDKDDINYDEVFTEVEEGARLVFEGRPGCGKTTILNKVSQDWAIGKIFSSSLLFLVHLWRFGNRSDINLKTLLCSTPVDFSDEEFQQMQTQIERNKGKGVVFALDGLDEYCPDKKKYNLSFIHKLIKREKLPNSIVIVASRPAASQKYRKNATKCIEVLGFLKQQIYEYIDNYFDKDQDKMVGLTMYLEHHPNVMHMCYLPLHMAMIAYLYDIEGASLPQTETDIYKHFTLSTLIRSIKKKEGMELNELFYLSSFEDLSPDDKKVFDLILELAFQATVVEVRQVFSHNDVRNFFYKQSSNTGNDEGSLGLVVVDWSFVKHGLEEIYTFLHLTFQEFLAACYIVQLNSQKQKEIISEYGGDEKLGVVWKFYCGMTHFSEEQKMHNFEQLFERTKHDILLQLHCAHESQQDIICTHTVKSHSTKIILKSSSLNPADFTALGYVLTHSNVPTTELAITSCNIGPEGLSALTKAIDTSSLTLRAISFHRTKIKKMIPEFCSCLKTCPQLCTLILSSCGIIKKALSEMAEMLPTLESLEKLDLSYNDLGVQSMKVLGSVLAKFPNLKSLVWIKSLITLSLFTETLKGRDIEISLADSENSKSSMKELVRLDDFKLEDISLIFNYFQAHPCTAALIGTLSLGSRGIDDVIAESLAKGILHCTNLQELDLSGNNIGDAGAQTLAEGLQRCTNLQELDLTDNNIGIVGARALIESLRHCTNLWKFFLLKNINGTTGAGAIVEGLPLCTNPQSLKGNNIGDAGAQILAISLQYCTNLKELDLGKNDIGDTGTQAIAQSLHHCTNLLVLIFRKNSIGNGGAQTLAEGLQHCTNLQKLDLVDNNIGDAGAQALAESLRHCTNLKELYLWKNNIGVVGAQALAEGLPHCTNPQNLNLRMKNIGDAGAQFLAISLQYYTDVQKLDLYWNNIGDAGAQALAGGLQHCTNLQELNLGENSIGVPGAQALAGGLQHCTNLQELNLRVNNIGVPGAQALAGGLQHCTNLQKLNLISNNIGDAGAQALAEGLLHCTSLQVLLLIGNNIGDAGAQALAKGLQHCTNLQDLSLRKNNIGDAGAQALAEGLQYYSNLHCLSLSENSLTNSSIGSLSQLIRAAKQLNYLFVGGNKFAEDGQRALRAAAEERNSNPDFAKLDLNIW